MNVFDITSKNEHWQDYASNLTNMTLYLYNAYFDNRESVLFGSSVRITAMAQRKLTNNDTYYCLYWFNTSTNPIISDTTLEFERFYTGNDSEVNKFNDSLISRYESYLLTCKVSHYHNQKIPEVVSIVDDGSKKDICFQASNYLRII